MKKTKFNKLWRLLQNNTKKRRPTKKKKTSSGHNRLSKKSKKIQRGGGPDEFRFKNIVNCVRKYNALGEYYRLHEDNIRQTLLHEPESYFKNIYNTHLKILVDPEKQVIEQKILEMYFELQKYNCGFYLLGKNPISIEDASFAVLNINRQIAENYTTIYKDATENIERWFPTRNSNDHFEYLHLHDIDMLAIAFDALFTGSIGPLPTDESSPFSINNPPSWMVQTLHK